MNERLQPMEAGHAALARGAWAEALDAFDTALASGESAEAHEGRALAARWLELVEVVFESRHAAYRLYSDAGDSRGAGRVAMRLAESYGELKADTAVAQGWLQRAERLLEPLPPGAEQARLAAMQAGLASFMGEPEKARVLAEEATRIARSIGSVGDECFAMAIHGRILVAQGDVAAGMALLDEATATATSGTVSDLEVVPGVCCLTIAACERIRDFDRAAAWCERVETYCADYLSRSLFTWCRTSYAGALVWWGEWSDAETELQAAIELAPAARPGAIGNSVLRLAELRIRQGRIAEATALIERLEGTPNAALGRASLSLEQSDPERAVELVERFLRSAPTGAPVERVAAVEILVAALLAAGDVERAESAGAELRQVAEAVGTDPLLGSARLADGMVFAARGDHASARPALEDAVDLFERCRTPYEAGRARLALAATLGALSRPDEAAAEYRAALAGFAAIGAEAAATRAERLLAQLGDGSGSPVTAREAEVLRLVAEGLSDKQIAARLVISEHTVHRHVSNIRTKLRAPSRSAAAAQAARRGLI